MEKEGREEPEDSEQITEDGKAAVCYQWSWFSLILFLTTNPKKRHPDHDEIKKGAV